MRVDFVGLGRMGFNMVTRLAQDGQQVIATTRDQEKVRQISAEPHVSGAASLEEMVAQLEPPRAVWIMVTAGEAADSTIKRVAALLSPGDTIVDAGNSNFRDSIRHGQELAGLGIDFMDEAPAGVS